MKVKELIEILQKMPQDAEVIYCDAEDGWCTPCPEYITEYYTSRYSPKPKKAYGKFVDLTAD